MSSFAKLLSAAEGLDAKDDAAIASLRDSLQAETTTWDRDRLAELRRVMKEERRRHGCVDPEGFVARVFERACEDISNIVSTHSNTVRPDSEPEEWPEPEWPAPPTPTPLPLAALPTGLREHVHSTAGSTQTHPDMAIMLSILAVSAALRGKVVIDVRDGYVEPLNLYAAVVLPPGTRKSPVFKLMTAPIAAFELNEADRIRGPRGIALEFKQVADIRLQHLRQSVAKGGSSEEELENALRESLQNPVPAAPRIIVSDVTPERLAQLMAENHGAIAILSPEGDPLNVFGGRYHGGSPVFDHLKKAWGGEAIRDDRVGREGTHVRRPSLTVGLTLQPGFLKRLGNAFRGEGVLARFLWVVPKDLVGNRLTGTAVPNLDASASRDYGMVLARLLAAKAFGEEEDGSWIPHHLTITDAARDVLYAFEAEVEELLQPGHTLGSIRDWGGKIFGNTVRIAGLLQVADNAAGAVSNPLGGSVSVWAVESAVALARPLMTHTVHLFHTLDAPQNVLLARLVMERIDELKARGTPTERDLFERVKGTTGLSSMSDLRSVLSVLETLHMIRRTTQTTDGPGRPRSPSIVINPRWSPSQNSQKAIPGRLANSAKPDGGL